MPNISHGGSKTVGKSCHMNNASFHSRISHFANLLSIQGKRFFAHDVLATLGSCNGLFVVSKVRRSDDHCIDFGVVTNLLKVSGDFVDAPVAFALLKLGFTHIAGRDQFGARVDIDARHMVIITYSTGSDDSDANWVGIRRHNNNSRSIGRRKFSKDEDVISA